MFTARISKAVRTHALTRAQLEKALDEQRAKHIRAGFMKRVCRARFRAFGAILVLLLASCHSTSGAPPFQTNVMDGLKVSANHRYLVDAVTGEPVFILADTAWNLGALTLEEIDAYLQSREEHGFNVVMFALNFAPQANEKNAYGQPAYVGTGKIDLNPLYFAYSDAIVGLAAKRGLFVMLYAMWAGEKAGTMNQYTAEQLNAVGQALGRRYCGVPNVIFCAGGEASPDYIDVKRVNAIGAGLKVGCAGRNLVTVHPVAPNSSSKFYAFSTWLDFYMIQAKSGSTPGNADYDAAALVLGDWNIKPAKPTMIGEHRYESGTKEDPLIQRRSMYQCVFAGACGHAYGHDALWQMTPHTGKPWMLEGWTPGVANWREALDTPAVRQLQHIKALLYSHPYLQRIPDQSLVLAGQGPDVATRTQATRDGTTGRDDATYVMAYISAPRTVTLRTAAICSHTLNAYGFSPESGSTQVIQEHFTNPGAYTVAARSQGEDWVVVVEDASRNYPRP